MFINKDIPENDKIILNKLGKNADTSIQELLSHTQYKRKSSIYNRIRKLREEKFLFGPYFDINYNSIGSNKLYSVFVFAEYNPVYREVVLEAMKKINCWIMIYPVRTVEVYLGIYRCNNWNYLASLFKLLKQWGWLKEYAVYKSEYRWIMQNPDFFSEFMPPQNYQIPGGRIPHYCYEDIQIDSEFTKTDLIILKHLSRRTSHLTRIRDLEYSYYGLKLRYHDLKRSYQRLIQTGILIKKNFIISPLPHDMCSLFFLISKRKSTESLEMIANFGRDLRLNKTLIMTGGKVISYFLSYPLLEGRILGILDNNGIDAKIYGIKTYPSNELLGQTFNDDYFDLENQKWIFPYFKFREELKKLKEEK